MKICHWTQYNHSGMNNVAREMQLAERELGLNSIIVNCFEETDWDHALDADVHVAHTWFPEIYRGKNFRRQLTKPARVVMVSHGTPENIFLGSLEAGRHTMHGMADGLMLWQYWLQHADALVTFWPRHQALMQTMVDRNTTVDLVPMGVDPWWWKGGTRTEIPGTPSLLSAENPHVIKCPMDLILAWPLVYPHLDNASLHLGYVVTGEHRQYAPLINRNGAGYGMHWSATKWGTAELRDRLTSFDFFIGLVRYGDFNMLSMQANQTGRCKTISYPGNPYSDFWVPEGNQVTLAAELVRVLKGEVEPRQKDPVPDVSDMAKAMVPIYERLLPPMPIKALSPEHIARIMNKRRDVAGSFKQKKKARRAR